MNAQEYIIACKAKLNIKTNYRLALELDLKESDVNFYAHGQRLPDVYACFKFAECLGIEPTIIIADIASESEKNDIKRNYFKGFIGRCVKAVAALILTTALMHSASEETAFAV